MKNSCSDEGEILFQLNEIYKQMSPKFERCTGISQSRLELLHKLFEVDEISQTALQKVVNIDSAAVTRHLKQLELKEMVTRRKKPDDNRFTFVKLTEEGREKIAAFRKEKEEFIGKVLKDFSEQEQTQLSTMLHRIQSNIEEIQY